jgi:hypothetical protein
MCPSATVSIPNPTYTVTGVNLGLWSERLVTPLVLWRDLIHWYNQ